LCKSRCRHSKCFRQSGETVFDMSVQNQNSYINDLLFISINQCIHWIGFSFNIELSGRELGRLLAVVRVN